MVFKFVAMQDRENINGHKTFVDVKFRVLTLRKHINFMSYVSLDFSISCNLIFFIRVVRWLEQA